MNIVTDRKLDHMVQQQSPELDSTRIKGLVVDKALNMVVVVVVHYVHTNETDRQTM